MNDKNNAALAFMVLLWTAILICIGWNCYNKVTGPDGLGSIHFKTVDEMLDGNH
jgi:hypothetical protein